MNKITKAKLISEIAETTKLNKKQVSEVLNTLTQISYREAKNGFVVPGICKLSVVRRKERRCRIPSTGQLVMIGERDAVKITPIGAIKNHISPKHLRKITVIDSDPSDSVTSKIPAPDNGLASTPPHPSTPETRSDTPDSGSIVFSCGECGSMISAPSTCLGKNAECPFCGIEVQIPLKGEESTPSGEDAQEGTQASGLSEGFMTFFCGECGQEIESSVSMAGLEASCPTCGSHIDIPHKSTLPNLNKEEPDQPTSEAPNMTMRIDLLDL